MTLTEMRAEVLAACKLNSSKWMSVYAIQMVSGLKNETIRRLLPPLVHEGQLVEEDGRYRPPRQRRKRAVAGPFAVAGRIELGRGARWL